LSAWYRKLRLQTNISFLPVLRGLSGRNQSPTQEEFFSSDLPFGGTFGKSAVFLCYSPDHCSLCSTWLLYRLQMVLFFLFILLPDCALLGTIQNRVWKCVATCKSFFHVFYKRYSIRINCTIVFTSYRLLLT